MADEFRFEEPGPVAPPAGPDEAAMVRLTALFLVGWFILGTVALWLIYRIVNGWLPLSERRPLPV